MSKTGMAVEQRKFSKIPKWRHYLLKTRARAKRKNNWQNHWEWLQQVISKRLKAMGMIQRQGNGRGGNRKGFYIALWLTTKNRSTTRIPSAENRGECPEMLSRRRPNRIFTVPRLCSAFRGTSSVWCIMSCWNRVKPSQGIGIEHNWIRLSRALKEKWSQYQERHDKVILQHDKARPHVARLVKTYLETLKWEVLSHPLYSPDVAPFDYHLFRSTAHGLAHQHFRSYEEVEKWIDS